MRARIALLLFVLVAATVAATAQAAGAWTDTAILPTLRQGDWQYSAGPLSPTLNTSLAGSGITWVAWRYHYQTWHHGFRAALCTQGICVDASTERGGTDAFAGLPVDSRFQFYLWVSGQEMLTVPMRGGRLRLIVNFE